MSQIHGVEDGPTFKESTKEIRQGVVKSSNFVQKDRKSANGSNPRPEDREKERAISLN